MYEWKIYEDATQKWDDILLSIYVVIVCLISSLDIVKFLFKF